jgi:hypothetical protein
MHPSFGKHTSGDIKIYSDIWLLQFQLGVEKIHIAWVLVTHSSSVRTCFLGQDMIPGMCRQVINGSSMGRVEVF